MADHGDAAQQVGIYHPKDAIGNAMQSVFIVGGFGLAISTVQSALTRQNVGMMSVFTKTGGTAAAFAAMGGAYTFAKDVSSNLREKEDTWNTTWGGFASGAVLGLRARSMPAMFGYGSALAVVVTAFTFTGTALSGYRKDTSVDEVDRKEYLRKNRRRNIEETINELGEGRGIYAPGYEERRAQRLKEKYGIDVPVRQSS